MHVSYSLPFHERVGSTRAFKSCDSGRSRLVSSPDKDAFSWSSILTFLLVVREYLVKELSKRCYIKLRASVDRVPNSGNGMEGTIMKLGRKLSNSNLATALLYARNESRA